MNWLPGDFLRCLSRFGPEWLGPSFRLRRRSLRSNTIGSEGSRPQFASINQIDNGSIRRQVRCFLFLFRASAPKKGMEYPTLDRSIGASLAGMKRA